MKLFDLIVVCGPTASGKSALAIEIAKKFDGEIVSADSMQIYKEMDVGTAKPTEDELAIVPHHLVNIKSVTEEYNVSAFVNDAEKAVSDIIGRSKLPIIAGGTGLYIDSFINNIDFQKNEKNEQIRENLKCILVEKGEDYLFSLLKEVDPCAAETIHKNNTKRVMRALEINYSTGKTVAQNNLDSLQKPKYKALFIGVNFKDREKLYSRINSRVDIMFSNGLEKEAENIKNMPLSSTAAGAIGYKELFDYFDGKCSFNDAVELLKQKTRNYAKRQITWFKRNKNINWFYPDEYIGLDLFIKDVLNFISDSEV